MLNVQCRMFNVEWTRAHSTLSIQTPNILLKPQRRDAAEPAGADASVPLAALPSPQSRHILPPVLLRGSHHAPHREPLLMREHRRRQRVPFTSQTGRFHHANLRRMKRIGVAILLFVCALSARAADKLTIVKAGPVGEVASLAEANEIRVVFSEPMVVVGKIPKVLDVPWFHVAPAINGTFRWSGTTTLIFTPDPKTPLPFATKYDVTVDAEAKAVSGKTLGKVYRFSFTTPTIQLLRTDWYRKGGRWDGSVVIVLWFNQPVDAETLGPHIKVRTVAHEFKAPELPARDRLEKLEPEQVKAFDAKVAKAQAAAASDGQPVLSFFPADWDKERYKPKPELVVLETKPGVPPDTHLQVFIDDSLAKSATNVA